MLRALALPGADHVLRLVCRTSLTDAGRTVVEWARRVGFGPTPAAEEIGRGYTSLTDPPSRRAFLSTLRAVIGVGGQRVSANDRLQLAADLPTLIVWGAGDPIIPVEHAHRAHAAITGSRLEIFEDVGHFPHCEAPERFSTAVSDFVASTEPARLSQQQLRARLQALPS